MSKLANDLTTIEILGIAARAENEAAKYYWKIKSVDAAGNEGAFTDFRRFSIKNEK